MVTIKPKSRIPSPAHCFSSSQRRPGVSAIAKVCATRGGCERVCVGETAVMRESVSEEVGPAGAAAINANVRFWGVIPALHPV